MCDKNVLVITAFPLQGPINAKQLDAKEETMAWLRNTVEASLFIPVSGGYIFRAPNKWLLGREGHYFITNAQKSQLLSIASSTPRWILRLGMLSLLLCGMAAALVAWTFTGGAFDAAIAIVKVLAVTGLIAIPFIAIRLTVSRLAPILAGLPRADA
jgi:hypothetical protein